MAAIIELLKDAYPGLVDAQSIPFLERLNPLHMAQGAVLFRPGDAAQGFVLVLKGRVGVYLTGVNGRELKLYTVTSGTSCIQTTLGLLGGDTYSGEAIAETDLDLMLIPAAAFKHLIEQSAAFRVFVFKAFGKRMHDVTHTLEQVAFVRVEARLAAFLLSNADGNSLVAATHQSIATAIGSVREVVSRRLEALSKSGLIEQERGQIRILDRTALADMAGDSSV
jgi:CRP/FNR family transcriptional regulator, anaerobic regulatory protein